MGRLDKRAARDEDDRAAREYKQRVEQAYERHLRGQEIAAAQAAEQETLVAEVYDLVDEFLELMEEKDYPGLETATLPMTRWWWPFPRPTRKAVWKLCTYALKWDNVHPHADSTEVIEVVTSETVCLLADDRTLVVVKTRRNDTAGIVLDIEFRTWQGEYEAVLHQKLQAIIAECSR